MREQEPLTDEDYRQLLRFRNELRRFLRWSEQQAARVGMTAAHHQLLLAIRGHPSERPPTMTDVARHLLLKHNSAVERVDRAEAAGLVRRTIDREDSRVVRLALTQQGAQRLHELSALHLEELRRMSQNVASLNHQQAGTSGDGEKG